jgi:hypothetical protein
VRSQFFKVWDFVSSKKNLDFFHNPMGTSPLSSKEGMNLLPNELFSFTR